MLGGHGDDILSQFGQLDPCRQVGAAVTAKHRWGSSSQQSDKKASTRLGNHLGRSRGCYFGLGSHFLSQFGQLDPCRQVGAAVAAKHRWGSSSEQSHRKASTRLGNHLGMLFGCSNGLGWDLQPDLSVKSSSTVMTQWRRGQGFRFFAKFTRPLAN